MDAEISALKFMLEQISGLGELDMHDIAVFAEFAPLPDLTAYELAQARVGIGEYRTFTDEEWEAQGAAQRHWKRRAGA